MMTFFHAGIPDWEKKGTIKHKKEFLAKHIELNDEQASDKEDKSMKANRIVRLQLNIIVHFISSKRIGVFFQDRGGK